MTAMVILALGVAAATPPSLTEVVSRHNRWRHQDHPDAPTLVWNPALAETAQAWAQTMDRRQQMAHDPRCCQGTEATGMAENLARGPTPEVAATLWYEEKAFYHQLLAQGQVCDAALGAAYNDCGHYVNLINPDYNTIGCGVSGSYLVCRYGIDAQRAATAFSVGDRHRIEGRCVVLTEVSAEGAMVVLRFKDNAGFQGMLGGTVAMLRAQLASCPALQTTPSFMPLPDAASGAR